jgi:DNA-binding PadR family transcriptional regulator
MSDVPLAPRDLLILAALIGGELHGYGLIKAVEARSEGEVELDPANLYRALRRMARDGWIREVTSAADAEARRRMYAITASGRAVLRREVERLDELLRQVRPALASGRSGRRT